MARRLTAILAADVVGFSRMMEVDEAGTLALLRSTRTEVFDPAVIMRKLDLHSGTELLRYALKKGLVSLET